MDEKKEVNVQSKSVSTIKDFISTLGFPIVVAGWLLYERYTMLANQDKTISELTDAINRNTELIAQLYQLLK